MQQDLLDAAAAVTTADAYGEGKEADPERVAVLGSSFGGYAALAGLAFHGDSYACAVDAFGPSELKLLTESWTGRFGQGWDRQLRQLIGPVESDEDFDHRVSPAYHLDQITKPLLVAQGARDPRVPVEQSDLLLASSFAGGENAEKPAISYLRYSEEGHGFMREPDRLDFLGRAENFLAGCLGGKAEPWEVQDGVKVEVVTGDRLEKPLPLSQRGTGPSPNN